MPDKKISVIVDAVATAPSKQALPSIEQLIGKPTHKIIELEVSPLTAQMSETLDLIFEMLSGLPESSEQYEVTEVTFSVGLGVNGEVSLVSTLGGSLESHTGITFTLSRIQARTESR